jgi:hypothetical protein
MCVPARGRFFVAHVAGGSKCVDSARLRRRIRYSVVRAGTAAAEQQRDEQDAFHLAETFTSAV